MGWQALRRRGWGCVVIAIGVGLGACGRPSSRSPEVHFGVEQNPTRAAVGLPPVRPDWRHAALDRETLVWSSPQDPQSANARRYDKLVAYDRGRIVEEVDFYTNGRKYNVKVTDTDMASRLESVVIHYNYERAARGVDPWACALTRGPQDEKLTLPQAEQVLASWGLRRVD